MRERGGTETARQNADGRWQQGKAREDEEEEPREHGRELGGGGGFLQAVKRKAGILQRMAGEARAGEAELEEREFERRMRGIYVDMNWAWNSRHGEPFPSEPEEMERRGRFPGAVAGWGQ